MSEGINRFYQPSSSQYISQFVPDELPADLMLKGLALKQGKYDAQAAKEETEIGNWKQRALPGYDTAYVNQKKSELETFRNKSMSEDKASPTYLREYAKFVNDFKSDKGLAAVNYSVTRDDEAQKRIKELKEGAADKYDAAFVDNYNRAYNIYTHPNGKGYTGNTQIGDPSILEGVNQTEEQGKLFNIIKDSGYESMQKLASGISYENGWKGVDNKRISKQVGDMIDVFYNDRAGQQLRTRYDAENVPAGMTYQQYFSNLSPKEQAAYENKKKSDVMNQLFQTGKGYTHSLTETGEAEAKNKEWEFNKKEIANTVQDHVIKALGNTTKISTADFKQANEQYVANNKNLREQTDMLTKYNNIYSSVNGANTLQRDESGRLVADNNTLALLQGIPGADKFVNGKTMTSEEKALFNKSVQEKINDQKYTIQNINVIQKDMENRLDNAIDGITGNRKYGKDGVSYRDAIEIGSTVKADARTSGYANNVQNLISSGHGGKAVVDYLAMKRTEVLNDAKTGAITEDEKNYRLNGLDNIHTWSIAESMKQEVTKNPIYKNALKTEYEKEQYYQPVATIVSTTPKYVQRTLRDGKVINMGSAERADVQMENLAKTNPNSWAIYLDGKRLQPGDDGYPDPATIKFGSVNTEMLDGKPVYNGTGLYMTIGEKPTGETKDPKMKFATQKITGNYTFVAEGVDLKTYNGAKAAEAYSNVLADPNYDPKVPLSQQKNLSTDGQASLQDYVAAKDPSLGQAGIKVTSLQPGEKTIFQQTFYNGYTGKDDSFVMHVEKNNRSGDYILEIKDSQGRNLLPNVKELGYSNPAELVTAIADIKENFNKLKGDGTTPPVTFSRHPDDLKPQEQKDYEKLLGVQKKGAYNTSTTTTAPTGRVPSNEDQGGKFNYFGYTTPEDKYNLPEKKYSNKVKKTKEEYEKEVFKNVLNPVGSVDEYKYYDEDGKLVDKNGNPIN